MSLTNPYNPYLPYTANLQPNQYQTATPNTIPMSPLTQTSPYQPAWNNNQASSTIQPQAIYGHIVSDEAEIKPNEVPMDGTIAFFPKSDLSEIIAKQWVQNGTIQTVRFVPVVQQASEETPKTMSIDELAQSMDSRFNEIKSMLKYRNGGRGNQKNSADSKESSDD